MTVPKSKYPKKKAKLKIRKVTPIPDKPNSYIVEHEVHDAPVPPPLDVPIPEEALEMTGSNKSPVHRTWVEWWKSLW
jgi:hypothetical protein